MQGFANPINPCFVHIDHTKHIKCLNWDIFLFHEKYSLILNLMAAEHLIKVGTGSCLSLCTLSPLSSVCKRLWTWEELSHCHLIEDCSCSTVRGFLHCTFSLIKHQMLSKPCCCNRCSVWFNIVLLQYARPSLKTLLSGWEHMLL